MGRVITFYSYKGGVGRSMALANTGVLLAQWGYRVLLIDFDLEAPGLENFFSSFIDMKKVQSRSGIVDFIGRSGYGHTEFSSLSWQNDFVNIPLPRAPRKLRIWNAGRRDRNYFKRVQHLDFRQFYSIKNGGILIEELRNRLKKEYDFILVDSRTGLTEIGGICTVQLPDMIVLLFTATEQAFKGGLDIVNRALASRQKMPFERLLVPTVPIPSRFDVQSEYRLTQRWLDRFARESADLYASWLPRDVNPRTLLDMTKLPQISFFSFGETLPVLEHGRSDPGGLGYAYENLAALVATNLQNVEHFVANRETYINNAAKTRPPAISGEESESKIFISYNHRDKQWFDRLRTHLLPLTRSRDLVVWDDTNIKAGANWLEEITRSISDAKVAVLLVSPDYLASDFIADRELPVILKGAEDQGMRVLWIALSHTLVEETEIARFQSLNNPAEPLSSLDSAELDRVLANVARKIAEAAGQKY